MESLPTSAFMICSELRKLAKRAASLPAEGEGKAPSRERTALLEDLWFLGFGLNVWENCVPQGCLVALFHVYDREGSEAAEILTMLADEALKSMSDVQELEETEEERGDE